MNAIVAQSLGALPAVFRGQDIQNNMAEGISTAFAGLTFKGKVWGIRYRGATTQLLLPPATPGGPPAGAKPTADVIIINASPAISKMYYEDGFTEGDKDAPDCSSVDGVKPDPAAPKPQCATCAACPNNVWGSKIMPSGKAGKRCQDYKRLAVVPSGDMRNEMFGGPMLLRVPAASLADMQQYSNNLQAQGYPYYAVETQLSFDVQQAYPKLVFTATRVINDAEAVLVQELQNDPRTKRLLAEAVDRARHEGVEGSVVAQPGSAQPGSAQGFAGATAAHAAPAAAAAAPAPEYVMAAGETFTRDQYLASGWTDEQLLTAGKMVRKAPPAPPAPPVPPVAVAPPPTPVPPTAPPAPPVPPTATADPGPIPAHLVRQPALAAPVPVPQPVSPAPAAVTASPPVTAPPPAASEAAPEAAPQVANDPMPAHGTPEFAAWIQRQAAAAGVALPPPTPASTRRRGRPPAPPPSPTPTVTDATDLNQQPISPPTTAAPAAAPVQAPTPPAPVAAALSPPPPPSPPPANDPGLADVEAELERLLGN